MAERPEVGDWVQVWGLVAETHNHPEDVTVRFESHNSDYLADVRLDRVLSSGLVPEFASKCTDLYSASGGFHWQCTQHAGHRMPHISNSGSLRWSDDQTSGYFEEA